MLISHRLMAKAVALAFQEMTQEEASEVLEIVFGEIEKERPGLVREVITKVSNPYNNFDGWSY